MTRGIWDRETVALMLLAAYLPLAGFWLWFGGAGDVARLGLALVVIAVWHLVFMLARAQPPSLAAIVVALAIAILAPQDLGAFRLVLGISFGAVMGELVFGGWGRNVVNPATVALSFLGFGFPGFPWPDFVEPVAWAAIATGAIGVATGAMPAAVLAGAIVVLAVGRRGRDSSRNRAARGGDRSRPSGRRPGDQRYHDPRPASERRALRRPRRALRGELERRGARPDGRRGGPAGVARGPGSR